MSKSKVRPKITISCIECGTLKNIRVWNLLNVFVSRDYRCYRCARRKNLIDNGLLGAIQENNPNWKGGKVPYYGPGWKKARLEVRKRDKVCQTCGITPEENGKELDVHHKIPFRLGGGHDMNNLEALCHPCHMRKEDYGRGLIEESGCPRHPVKVEIAGSNPV